nr:unnamed protein product [Digitaria exilis]
MTSAMSLRAPTGEISSSDTEFLPPPDSSPPSPEWLAKEGQSRSTAEELKEGTVRESRRRSDACRSSAASGEALRMSRWRNSSSSRAIAACSAASARGPGAPARVAAAARYSSASSRDPNTIRSPAAGDSQRSITSAAASHSASARAAASSSSPSSCEVPSSASRMESTASAAPGGGGKRGCGSCLDYYD